MSASSRAAKVTPSTIEKLSSGDGIPCVSGLVLA